MLRLLLGRDWTANRDLVLNRIAGDIRAKKGNRILIVPELISHETERRLCAVGGDTASRYAEVLSFTRLARRVSDDLGSAARECLDNGGRVVAMAATARQLSSRLKAYASVETKPEFLTGLIDAVDEFKRCCISSGDIRHAAQVTEGGLAQKLEELSLIMEGYDSLCSRGKRDPRDQMTWLLEQLEEGTYGQEHIFYIDGFPDFTRQNLAVLEHLIQVSPEVTVSINCDRMDSSLLAFEKAGQTAKEIYRMAERAGVEIRVEQVPEYPLALGCVREKLFQGSIHSGMAEGSLQAIRAESPYQECMGAAKEILSRVAEGCRYRDITVVYTDPSLYRPLAELVFHRFHIPVYQSGTEEILRESVISTVLNALEAVFSGFEQRNVLRYLRSALSPLEPDTCDLVENYAVIWGIRGQKWLKVWENHPDGLGKDWTEDAKERLDYLNACREETMAPLAALRSGFREAKNLREQVEALAGFLEAIALDERLGKLAEEMDAAGNNRSAQILNQLWEILLSALEQLHDVLGESSWEPEHFLRLLRLLLSQYDVGTIPPVLDAVQMGPVSVMRCHQEKHLIVLGAEEGKLPGYTGSTGVLTDQERVQLRQLGVPLTGGAMEGIQAEFAEIYGVFCGATESIRVFCSGEQPSFVFRRLCDMAGKEAKLTDTLGFAQADAREAAAYLSGKEGGASVAKGLGLAAEYAEAREKQSHSLGKVTPENILRLYGSTLQLSASQVDRQAECKLSYFLKYGLRAQERKEAAVDPAEFGTYVHAVLENTARCIRDMGGFHQVSLEETRRIAHRFSQEYARERFSQIDSDRVSYLFRRNIRELDMVVEELWQELSQSQFQPEGFEVGFGKDQDLPPIAIPNKAMNAILRGFVDRVDVWNNGYGSYYRVVDYKTGKKSFDYCDVFNGVGLQMLLYLFALRSSGSELLGQGAVPAGVQYFPARVPYLSADGRLEPEEADKERKSQWKRSGLLLQDEAVLQAMEPGEAPSRCYSLKKDGTPVGDLADREQMKLLQNYVFHILGRLVEDIASGDVTADPYTRGTSHNACAYCPYDLICHAATVEGRRNYQKMTAPEFWEAVEKEETRHG